MMRFGEDVVRGEVVPGAATHDQSMFHRYLDALEWDEDRAIELTILVASAYEQRNVEAETRPWRAWKYVLPRWLL